MSPHADSTLIPLRASESSALASAPGRLGKTILRSISTRYLPFCLLRIFPGAPAFFKGVAAEMRDTPRHFFFLVLPAEKRGQWRGGD
jgi:hypothetical protein